MTSLGIHPVRGRVVSRFRNGFATLGNRLLTRAALIFCLTAGSLLAQPKTVLKPSDSPLVTFRILFNTGAASDPAGKQGVAALTAAMLSQGGSAAMSYDEIVDAFFPLAASVSAQVDKEMTVFEGTTHVENLDTYYTILKQMLLEPGWRDEDFSRLRDDQLNNLRIGLRSNNEEELGKEYLYLKVYEGHPYGHANLGTAKSLEAMTVDDLKAFYAVNYRQGSVTIGLAGGYPDGFADTVVSDFSGLPEGAADAVELPQPASAKKLRVHVIEKETRSTLISLGFPIEVNRKHADWPALKLVQSYLGQHRSSKSFLYQRIREIRGMNYGDYAYIEYFPRGMFLTQPEANVARQQQIFQIWIRPVVPENGLFALKIAMYELDKLVRDGMSEEDFDATKKFLSKYVNLLTQTQSSDLGYALDSTYYGLDEFNGWLKTQLGGLTREAVNAAIKKHLRATDLDIVMITKDAAGLKRALETGARATPQYASAPPQEILDEDKIIVPLKLDIGSVNIVPVDGIFEE